MLELPSVTLFCADCVDADRAIKAIERCKSVARFGAVKFLTHLPVTYEHRVEIPQLPSLLDYSIFMLKRAVNFIDTPHVLVVQHDGYIINAHSWNQAWLKYDYIAPLFLQDYNNDLLRVGSGGFSLRSKALMHFVDRHTPDWTGDVASTHAVQRQLNAYEDGVISHAMRSPAERSGFKYAPIGDAIRFAQGGWPQINSITPTSTRLFFDRPFGFHGLWQNIDEATGIVTPPPFIAKV